MSGVDLFPTTFTVAPCAIVVGATITKLGVYRWAVWAGWTLATLGESISSKISCCELLISSFQGFGLWVMLDVQTPTVTWIFVTLVTGIGTGMALLAERSFTPIM